MAAETINADSRIGMTFLAKTLRSENAVCLGIGVTVNTVFQTEISCPDSFSDGLIAVMQNKLKMLVTHYAFVTYALITPGDDLAVRAQRSGSRVFIAVGEQASRCQETCCDYSQRYGFRVVLFKPLHFLVITQAHLDVPGRTNVRADVASDATGVVGVYIAAHSRF